MGKALQQVQRAQRQLEQRGRGVVRAQPVRMEHEGLQGLTTHCQPQGHFGIRQAQQYIFVQLRGGFGSGGSGNLSNHEFAPLQVRGGVTGKV